MQRHKGIYTIAPAQYEHIKRRMLNWSEQFSILLFLDSNNYASEYSRYECLLAAGVNYTISANEGLEAVRDVHTDKKDWLFGHINYDYKNKLEHRLSSSGIDNVHFQDLFFFCPKIVCYIEAKGDALIIETTDREPDEVHDEIMSGSLSDIEPLPSVTFIQRTQREEYLDTINKLRTHIKDGDCYEINYCNESFAMDVTIKPQHVFTVLNKLSHAPFAAYYRNDDKYMMCASPERYLYKTGNTVISQPIKGTARRGVDANEDKLVKEQLNQSIKDKAENVMITDLVRNDLARSCEIGSVTVNELFGIYTFPQVHQMISTVSGVLAEDVPFTDAIKYSFPMGSMTGAPKIKVMELIEQYEQAGRGLFAGTVGYITPNGDFDFNVIIRSLFYNAASRYLCYQAGGAITYDSTAEGEWEEMRLKAWAMERIFNNNS